MQQFLFVSPLMIKIAISRLIIPKGCILYISTIKDWITNGTLTFRVKKTRGEIKNFGIETQSGNRENHAVQVPFWFIPISRSVAEIQGLKVSIALNAVRRLWMGPRPIFFPGNAYYVLLRIALLRFSRNRGSRSSAVWDRSARRGASERSD